MAKLFRQKTKDFNAPQIFYVAPMLYTLDEPYNGFKTFYAEVEIPTAELGWEKDMNNLAYCQEQRIASFSHFTYVWSKALFMVVDIQGA